MINRIMEVGEEMMNKYCPEDDRSLMFPLAPRSKFVDIFPKKMESKKEQKEFDKQIQYEGEVEVYKVLENQNIGLVVFHGFSYTHKQYSLFVKGHSDDCKKNDKDEEGECDFLVIHDMYLAILEVKVPIWGTLKDQNKAFKSNYSDSKKQRKRTKDLIFGICEWMQLTPPEVLDFTVFSNVDRSVVSKFPCYEKLSPEEKESILFMDDLKGENSNLSQRLAKSQESSQDGFLRGSQDSSVDETLQLILLGLWCYDDINDRINLKNVDLSETIKDLDCQLRISKISRVSSVQQPTSSLVVGATKTLRMLNIKFITKSQKSVLTNGKKKLWINGPAGSGKTLLIMGKVVELLDNSEEKVVVAVLNETVAKYYQQHLETANVSSVLYENVNEALLKTETESRVFIVHYKGDFVRGKLEVNESYRLKSITAILKTDYHVFLDDFHGLTAGMERNSAYDLYKIVFTELNSSSPRLFWVTYDILQDGYSTQHNRTCFTMRDVMKNVKDEECFQCLPNVLRNSRQIADLLSSIRALRLENERKELLKYHDVNSSRTLATMDMPTKEHFETFYKYMALNQEIGHYIHGPKPVRYHLATPWSNKLAKTAKVSEILTAELSKLGSTDVAIVVNRNITLRKIKNENEDDIDWKEECEKTIIGLDSPSQASIHNFDETFSAEWPAVICIVEFSRWMFCHENKVTGSALNELSNQDDTMDQLLSKLYITVSRARVYCCLILVTRDLGIFICSERMSQLGKGNTATVMETAKNAVLESFSKLESTLSKNMVNEGNYKCRSESDEEMCMCTCD